MFLFRRAWWRNRHPSYRNRRGRGSGRQTGRGFAQIAESLHGFRTQTFALQLFDRAGIQTIGELDLLHVVGDLLILLLEFDGRAQEADKLLDGQLHLCRYREAGGEYQHNSSDPHKRCYHFTAVSEAAPSRPSAVSVAPQ